MSAPARVTRSSSPASHRLAHSAVACSASTEAPTQAPRPAQVGQRRERRDQHVVALHRRDRSHRQQPLAGRRTLGQRGLVGSGHHDVQARGRDVVRRGQPVAGPATGAHDGVHSGERSRLRLAARRRTGHGESDREMHQGDQAETVPLAGQRVGGGGADQAVDDGDGTVREVRQHGRQAAGRRLVHHDVVTACAQRDGKPEVIDVPPARSRGVREADGPDEVQVQLITGPSRSSPRPRATRAA